MDTYIGLYTFEGPDSSAGTYLKERITPAPFTSDQLRTLNNFINSLAFSATVSSRSTPVVLRDGISRLAKFKDLGGSIIYLVTSTVSDGSEILIETDIAEQLHQNNIKIVVGESGPGSQSLSRVAQLSEGFYTYAPDWGGTSFFSPMSNEVYRLANSTNGLHLNRRTVRKNISYIWTPRTFYCSHSFFPFK